MAHSISFPSVIGLSPAGHLFEGLGHRQVLGAASLALAAADAARGSGRRRHLGLIVKTALVAADPAIQQMVLIIKKKITGDIHPFRAGQAIAASGAAHLDPPPENIFHFGHGGQFLSPNVS